MRRQEIVVGGRVRASIARRGLDAPGGHRDHLLPDCDCRGGVTRADRLTVELHQPTSGPPAILIKWPTQPSVTGTDPKGLASGAASVVRIMAEAQARLAKIRSKGRRS